MNDTNRLMEKIMNSYKITITITFCILFKCTTLIAHQSLCTANHPGMKKVDFRNKQIEESKNGNQITNDNRDSLIVDYNTYECRVLDITKLKNGYGIKLMVQISKDTSAIAMVVSKSADNNGIFKHSSRRIKRGRSYKIQLVRYFQQKILCDIENRPVYDILIGQETIGVVPAGWYNYIFVAPNLNGLYYINDFRLNPNTTHLSLLQTIKGFSDQFVNTVICKDDMTKIEQFADTILLKSVLNNYYAQWIGCRPDPKRRNCVKRSIPHFNWNAINANKNSIHSLISRLFEHFYNDDIVQFCDQLATKPFEIKILFFDPHKHLVTYKLERKTDKQAVVTCMILSVDIEDQPRIVGLNKPQRNLYFDSSKRDQ
jgi:hypothetical protein